jgi:hypothetical protein
MKRVHITLSDEVYEAIRELAYQTRTSISAVIDVLMEEDLVHPKAEPDAAPETPNAHKPH